MRDGLPARTPRPGLHRFRVLAGHLPPPGVGGRWLDLGGGAGEFARMAAEAGYAVTLVDGDPRNIEAVTTPGIRALLADLNGPLPELPDGAFDGVSLIEVVEHVPAAERLMREAFRAVKPGGVLLLSTPNSAWWRERLGALAGRPPEAEGYHFRFFTVTGARRLCEEAGFRVAHMEFSSPAMGVNRLLRWLSRSSRRRHVRVPEPLARLLARTTYVVAEKP